MPKKNSSPQVNNLAINNNNNYSIAIGDIDFNRSPALTSLPLENISTPGNRMHKPFSLNEKAGFNHRIILVLFDIMYSMDQKLIENFNDFYIENNLANEQQKSRANLEKNRLDDFFQCYKNVVRCWDNKAAHASLMNTLHNYINAKMALTTIAPQKKEISNVIIGLYIELKAEKRKGDFQLYANTLLTTCHLAFEILSIDSIRNVSLLRSVLMEINLKLNPGINKETTWEELCNLQNKQECLPVGAKRSLDEIYKNIKPTSSPRKKIKIHAKHQAKIANQFILPKIVNINTPLLTNVFDRDEHGYSHNSNNNQGLLTDFSYAQNNNNYHVIEEGNSNSSTIAPSDLHHKKSNRTKKKYIIPRENGGFRIKTLLLLLDMIYVIDKKIVENFESFYKRKEIKRNTCRLKIKDNTAINLHHVKFDDLLACYKPIYESYDNTTIYNPIIQTINHYINQYGDNDLTNIDIQRKNEIACVINELEKELKIKKASNELRRYIKIILDICHMVCTISSIKSIRNISFLHSLLIEVATKFGLLNNKNSTWNDLCKFYNVQPLAAPISSSAITENSLSDVNQNSPGNGYVPVKPSSPRLYDPNSNFFNTSSNASNVSRNFNEIENILLNSPINSPQVTAAENNEPHRNDDFPVSKVSREFSEIESILLNSPINSPQVTVAENNEPHRNNASLTFSDIEDILLNTPFCSP